MTVLVAKAPVKSHSDFSNSRLKMRCNMSFYSSLSVLVGTSKVMMIVKKINKQDIGQVSAVSVIYCQFFSLEMLGNSNNQDLSSPD